MSGGRFGGKASGCAGARMGEAEAGGVQRLAGKVQQAVADRLGQRARGGRHAAQVERVADDRVASAGQVNADLVRAPGGQAALQQGDGGAARRAACGSGSGRACRCG